jgi:hypothetical protein
LVELFAATYLGSTSFTIKALQLSSTAVLHLCNGDHNANGPAEEHATYRKADVDNFHKLALDALARIA